VMCLDMLRAMEREADAAQALIGDWRDTAREHPALSRALDLLGHMLKADPASREASARRIARLLVLVAQGVLLARHASADVSDAFIDTRLGDACGESGWVYGTLPASFDHAALIDRAFPG
jgi:putative acyl-CoA dehydrogenase